MQKNDAGAWIFHRRSRFPSKFRGVEFAAERPDRDAVCHPKNDPAITNHAREAHRIPTSSIDPVEAH